MNFKFHTIFVALTTLLLLSHSASANFDFDFDFDEDTFMMMAEMLVNQTTPGTPFGPMTPGTTDIKKNVPTNTSPAANAAAFTRGLIMGLTNNTMVDDLSKCMKNPEVLYKQINEKIVVHFKK